MTPLKNWRKKKICGFRIPYLIKTLSKERMRLVQ
jgi:hypothetical protein